MMYGEIMRDQRDIAGPESDRLNAIWQKVVEAAESELGREPVKKWIRPVSLSEIDRDRVILGAPTSFVADWVERNYGLHLLRYFQSQLGHVRRLSVQVEERVQAVPEEIALAPEPATITTHSLRSEERRVGDAGRDWDAQ